MLKKDIKRRIAMVRYGEEALSKRGGYL